jgi:hypothetical protein
MAKGPATKATGKKKQSSGPWSEKQRRRLSAIRAGGEVPEGFFHTVESAWAVVGGGDPLPKKLSPETEKKRALRWGGATWDEKAGRCFTEEGWNPLIALWSGLMGWDFVLDLLLPDGKLTTELATSDEGAPWYGFRRYMHAASPDAFAGARRRVEPLVSAPVPEMKPWESYPSEADALAASLRRRSHLLVRDYTAFAFDRDTSWAHDALRAFVEKGLEPANIAVLFAVATDLDLVTSAVKNWGSPGDLYFAYDIVESLGAKSLSVLDRFVASMAKDKKRLADARSIAEALAE